MQLAYSTHTRLVCCFSLFLFLFLFQVHTKVAKIERTTDDHDRRMHSSVKRENFSQAWGTQALQSTGIQHALLKMLISDSPSPSANPAMSLIKIFPAGDISVSISKLRIETQRNCCYSFQQIRYKTNFCLKICEIETKTSRSFAYRKRTLLLVPKMFGIKTKP